MSQINYINAMANSGYKEIDKSESPVTWVRKRKVIYLNKDDRYAMVDQHGQFVHWKHPEDTEGIKKRYEYEKKPKVKPITTGWTNDIGEEWY